MNSYELSLTAPSRQRVYRFHHLGPVVLELRSCLGKVAYIPGWLAGVGGFEPPTCGFGDRCSSI